MSIASEITRLQTAKANLKTAINNKGGSLTTETIDQYPTAINALQTGIDVSDANAVVGDVLTGKTFYAVDDTKKTGTMADNGTVNTDITTKAQEVTIAGGKHSGSGKVKISTTEQAKIIADNIKSGVSILGQAGGLTPAKEEETKTVTPNFASGNVVVTPTSGKVMSQVTFSKDTTNHIAGNIKKDITLYGVTGTYEGGGETLPTLNAPTISLSDSTVTITNPATNGNFVTGYKIYSNGTEVATSTEMSIDLSTILTDEGAYAMTVVATASGFADSVASNSVTFTVTPSGYEVQITFNGGSEVGYWVSTEIYDNYIIDDPYGLDEYEAQESGNKIGEILSANGTTTVTTTTGKICIKSQMSSDLNGGSSLTSQNITEIDVVGNWSYSSSPVCVPYIVNGNGTITISSIKWKY